MFLRIKKQHLTTFGAVVLMIVLVVAMTYGTIDNYKQKYVKLESQFPNVEKIVIQFDSFLSLPFTQAIPFFSGPIGFGRSMSKIIEENMPDLCMVNGNVQVKISDEQVAYTYGEDRLIDAQHREVRGFCIQKNDTEKIMKFLLENGEIIKEIVTIERPDGRVIMKRPNGYVVTLVK